MKDEKESVITKGLGGVLRSIADSGSSNITAPKEMFVVEKHDGIIGSRVSHRTSDTGPSLSPLEPERKGGLWKRYFNKVIIYFFTFYY